jgi:DNA-binding GntR family transcriptional regulator
MLAVRFMRVITSAGVATLSLGLVTDRPEMDPAGPKLVYVRVADHVTAKITSGELAPGAKLPAERELAAEYGVSYDTIRRASALLRERGLIETVHGRGAFVIKRKS